MPPFESQISEASVGHFVYHGAPQRCTEGPVSSIFSMQSPQRGQEHPRDIDSFGFMTGASG